MGTARSGVLKMKETILGVGNTVIGGSGSFKKEVGRDELKTVLDVGI